MCLYIYIYTHVLDITRCNLLKHKLLEKKSEKLYLFLITVCEQIWYWSATAWRFDSGDARSTLRTSQALVANITLSVIRPRLGGGSFWSALKESIESRGRTRWERPFHPLSGEMQRRRFSMAHYSAFLLAEATNGSIQPPWERGGEERWGVMERGVGCKAGTVAPPPGFRLAPLRCLRRRTVDWFWSRFEFGGFGIIRWI